MKQQSSHIGVAQVELYMPSCHSLKDKRRIIKSISDKVRKKWNISFSELGSLDKWQHSLIGMCMICNDQHLIDSTLQKILGFLDGMYEVQILQVKVEFL